jgi:hypothetical protein
MRRMDLIKEHVGDAVRIVPSWTPDRNLYNQIFDIVERFFVSVWGKFGSLGSHSMLVQDIEIKLMEEGEILLCGTS